MAPKAGIYLLDNPTKPYAWGSHTAIPRLLGLLKPSREPVAELWIGAHPEAPSQVLLDDVPQPLDAFIAQDPSGVLGAGVARRFDDKMPLLLKLLAAEQPLSIQSHPSKAQAEAGFQREETAGIARNAPHRCYRDDNHKPELIVALTPFRALCGFRPRDQISALLMALDAKILKEPIAAFSAGGELSTLYRAIMDVPDEQRKKIADEALQAATRRLAASAGFVLNTTQLAIDPVEAYAAFEQVLTLATRYPGDAGILSPLLLNMLTLGPEEALFLDAGELHAYLEGFGVEIMASSDNVLRGGLTSKHVDVKALLDTLTFQMGKPKVLKPEPTGASGERLYQTPVPDFSLAVVDVRDGGKFTVAEVPRFEILLAMDGTCRVGTLAGERLDLTPGRAALITPSAEGYAVKGGRFYRARVP